MLVVADTSPLNYLVWIGFSEILPQIYGHVVIPSAVRNELLVPEAPMAVRSWAQNLPGWVGLEDPQERSLDDPQLRSLHDGERAAIALAIHLKAAVVLIDERAGSLVSAPWPRCHGNPRCP